MTVLKWKIAVYVAPSPGSTYLVIVHSSVMNSPAWPTEVRWIVLVFCSFASLRIQGWTCHIYVNNSTFVPSIYVFTVCRSWNVR